MPISKTFTEAGDSFVANVNDTYQLDFAGGDDLLRVLVGTVTAHMGLGNDRVRVDGGSVKAFGEDGADRFDVFGGVLMADGGADDDRFNIFGGGNHTFAGGAGDDAIVFYSGAMGVQLSGGDGNDRFYGNHLAVSGVVQGGAGNDAFYDFADLGGLNVTLQGGEGNDVYRVLSASGPAVSEISGEGTDTVQIARGMSYTLGANLENLRVIDASGSEQNATLSGNELANLITGSSGQDVLYGLAGNDRLMGGAGNDVINGDDGNDRITGGLGADTLTGGAGHNVFIYSSAADTSGYGTIFGGELITDWKSADHIDLSAVDANSLIDGQQHFHFAGYSFGHPPPTHNAGDLWIAGFVTDLYVIGFTDNDASQDFVIELWSAGDEAALKADNIIL